MSRVRLAISAGVCVVAGAFGTAVALAAAPASAQLRAFVCQKALDPPARAVSIQAVMRPVAGTSKMQLRFDLYRQKPGQAFVLVRGRNLGSWVSPADRTLGQNPGDVWIVNHPVVDLSAPATYKFRVTFRWLGSQGQVLSKAVQSSPACYQPEMRADLLVRSLTLNAITSGPSAGKTTYTAVITNRGQTGAGPFSVQFTDGTGAAQSATLAGLGPHSSTPARFVGPTCTAGATLTVTVDPSDTVDEYDFANNTLTMPCPAPASPSG